MDRIAEDIHQKDISLDGLTQGEIHCHQRRVGSRVMYDMWLIQGLSDNVREFFIAENEINIVIKYLTEAKEEINIHRIKAKEAGHKTN